MNWIFYHEDEGENGVNSFIIEAEDNDSAFEKAYKSHGPQVESMFYKSITPTETKGEKTDVDNYKEYLVKGFEKAIQNEKYKQGEYWKGVKDAYQSAINFVNSNHKQ